MAKKKISKKSKVTKKAKTSKAKPAKKAKAKKTKKASPSTAKKAKKKVAKTAAPKAKAAAKKVQPKSAAPAKLSASLAANIFEPQVAVGQAVPDFELPMTGGKSFKLSAAKGKVIVLYFYPKDATPGCTIEGQDFTRLNQDFKTAGAEVLGISRDTMKSHESFKKNQSYTIDLLSDEGEKACAIFGAIKMKNMYGKEVRGINRSTFVIGRDGKLLKEWRSVNIAGHAEEVLDFVRSQKS